MSERLVSPREVGEHVASVVADRWPEAVLAERGDGEPFVIDMWISPQVRSGAAILRAGLRARTDWVEEWRVVGRLAPVELSYREVSVSQVRELIPAAARVTGLDAALAFAAAAGVPAPLVDVARARRIAVGLHDAGARLSASALRQACKLADEHVRMLTSAVEWFAQDPDLTSLTVRQVPVPGMDSKWLLGHGALVSTLVGIDVLARLRPRLAVAHVTYVDPTYLSTGGRRHDAWTTGDPHDLPYAPRTVVIVENRDCRLWFKDVPDAVVVEGGGKAAAALLADVPWIRGAEAVVYWGDLDADGFAILDRFRSAMAAPDAHGVAGPFVDSILMDGPALHRYEGLGVQHDRHGRKIRPSGLRLAALSPEEESAYAAVATHGPTSVRRIEQERIPLDDARDALAKVLEHRRGPSLTI